MNLIKVGTGEKVEASIEQLGVQEVMRLRGNKKFLFDWSTEAGNEVYRISLAGETDILGLISLADVSEELRIHINLIESSKENKGNTKQYDHIPGCLIGFACQLAFEKGYDGFVSLVAKTKLIDYYRNKFGFFPMGTHMVVFAVSAQEIIIKYLKHEEI